MDQLRYLALVSVARACGFGTLAIFSVMVGLSFDPVLSAKSGAILASAMVAVLLFKAHRAPHQPYRRTEVWLLLGGKSSLPERNAQRLVSGILRDTYLRFATICAAFAAAMWVLTLVLALIE